MTRMIQLLPVTLRWKLPQLVTLLRSCSQKNGDVQVCESEERFTRLPISPKYSLSSMIKIHSFFLNELIFMNFKFNFLTSTNSLQQSNIAKEYHCTNFYYRNFYSFYFL